MAGMFCCMSGRGKGQRQCAPLGTFRSEGVRIAEGGCYPMTPGESAAFTSTGVLRALSMNQTKQAAATATPMG